MNKNVCIFLGATAPTNQNYIHATKLLGPLLKKYGLNLIYGGGQRGLMGVLADSALNSAVKTTGVMSEDLLNIEIIHPGIEEIIETKTINQRKEKMIELSDYFIVMPGGIGTCEELFNTWCHIKITNSTKKIGLLNIDGFYDPFLTFIDKMQEDKFIENKHRQIIFDNNEVEALFHAMLCDPNA